MHADAWLLKLYDKVRDNIELRLSPSLLFDRTGYPGGGNRERAKHYCIYMNSVWRIRVDPKLIPVLVGCHTLVNIL